MPRKKDPLERLYKLDIRKEAMLIFCTAFRALLNYIPAGYTGQMLYRFLNEWTDPQTGPGYTAFKFQPS
jgi:hypothetical protein